jgi:flagellar hook-length control protein FliK
VTMPTLSATTGVAPVAAPQEPAGERSSSSAEAGAEFQGLLLALAGLPQPVPPAAGPLPGTTGSPADQPAAPLPAATATGGLPFGVAALAGTVPTSIPTQTPAAAGAGVAADIGVEPGTVPTAPLAADSLPTTAVPTTAVPADAVPADAVPADAVPIDAVPADGVPTVGLPATAVPTPAQGSGTVPADALRPTGSDPATDLPAGAVDLPAEATDLLPGAEPVPADGAVPVPADAAPPTGVTAPGESGTEANPDGQQPGTQVPGLPGLGAQPAVPPGTAQDTPLEVAPLGVDALAAALHQAPASAAVQQATALAPVLAAERPAPAPPAQQLAAEIVPLRDKNGEHSLTVSLHPVDLGPITVTARIQGTDIHLDLGGATESGREALRNALPDLRRELERAGFTSCLLDSNAGGSTGERRMPWQLPRDAGQGSGPASSVTGADLAPVRSRTGAGQLDLHA